MPVGYAHGMPELPEVEVIRRSLAPHLVGRVIERVRVRDGRLRQPVDRRKLSRRLTGARVKGVGRRAKYLLVEAERPVNGKSPALVLVAMHLGMSGRLTLVEAARPPEKHDHVLFDLEAGPGARGSALSLRFRDPRRFGLVVALDHRRWCDAPLFRHLGPEPLDPDLDAAHFLGRAERRTQPVKNFLMDARVVVGVGNIYASEALHRAGVDPRTPAGRLRRPRWERILAGVRSVLSESIAHGGTSLVDFRDGHGAPGLHAVSLAVYDRAGLPCHACGRKIRRAVLAGRSTFWCGRCQT